MWQPTHARFRFLSFWLTRRLPYYVGHVCARFARFAEQTSITGLVIEAERSKANAEAWQRQAKPPPRVNFEYQFSHRAAKFQFETRACRARATGLLVGKCKL